MRSTWRRTSTLAHIPVSRPRLRKKPASEPVAVWMPPPLTHKAVTNRHSSQAAAPARSRHHWGVAAAVVGDGVTPGCRGACRVVVELMDATLPSEPRCLL